MKIPKFLIVALLSVIVLLPGSFSVFDKDEPKYTEAAYELVESGDYITPYYNYSYRFDKPILTYWLIALGYKLFGVNEFGGRFFISLFGMATVIAVFLWLRGLKGEDFAFRSSLILLSSLDFLIMSSIAMPDIVLTSFITLSLISFYEGYRRGKDFYYVAAFALSGFATLTKGPVGIVLPGIIAVTYLILRRDLIRTLRRIPWVSGVLVFTAVVAPWYVAILKKHGYQFFRDFIIFHNVHRFLSKIPGHPTHWYYYLINFPWMFFPWSVVFPFAIWHLIKRERHHSVTDDVLHFCLIWFFGVVAFFQVAHTKLAHYLLPSFPAFAVIVSWYIERFRERAPILILILLSAFMSVGFAVLLKAKGLPVIVSAITVPFVLSTLLSLRFGLMSVAAGFISTMFLLKFLALPYLEPFRAKPEVGKELREVAAACSKCKFYFLDYTSPEIVYYFRSGRLEDVKPERARKLLSSDEPVFIVTRKNRLKRLADAEFSILEERKELITEHRIVIISNQEGERVWRRLKASQS